MTAFRTYVYGMSRKTFFLKLTCTGYASFHFAGVYTKVNWLPDSQRLLFSAREQSADPGYVDLYLVNDDGSDLVNLTDGIGNVWDFYPSPDGRHYLQAILRLDYSGGRHRDFYIAALNAYFTGDFLDALLLRLTNGDHQNEHYHKDNKMDKTFLTQHNLMLLPLTQLSEIRRLRDLRAFAARQCAGPILRAAQLILVISR